MEDPNNADVLHGLTQKVRSGLEAVSPLQSLIDSETWEIAFPPSQIITHSFLHLTKALGKIAALCERYQHIEYGASSLSTEELSILANELNLGNQLAELIVVAARTAGALGIDLPAAYLNLIANNCNRFAPQSEIARLLNTELDVS